MVQCFIEPKSKDGEGDKNMEMKDITVDMVKQRIRDLNIFPWQVFTLEQFKSDDNIGKIFTENTKLKADNERLEKEQKEMGEKNKEVTRKTEISEAQGKLDELMKEGYTDKQKQFIKEDFQPEKIEDLTDKGLGEYLENGKKKFAEQAKLFGVEEIIKLKPGEGTPAEEDMEQEALKMIGAIPDDKSK